ncbi:MAG: SpoVG family protein [Phycisphaerae bacterium]|jgi:stage V sporulation protein G
MEITEVRVKLIANKDERLKAFCSMTLDNDFVIRDIKVIMGTNGYFVAMPSRKMSDHCPKCGGKNHLRARFCNNCGASLGEDRAKKDMKGRMKLHADIAHPINALCRETIQAKIVEAFEVELEKSKLPGYKPVEFDEPDDDVPDDVAGHS